MRGLKDSAEMGTGIKADRQSIREQDEQGRQTLPNHTVMAPNPVFATNRDIDKCI